MRNGTQSNGMSKGYVLACSLLLLLVSCDRDACEPPFIVGPESRLGVSADGTIYKGKTAGIDMVVIASSATEKLENITFQMILPPEVQVASVFGADEERNVRIKEGRVYWKGIFRRSFVRRLLSLPQKKKLFVVWLLSKTESREWQRPIIINVSLDFEASRHCPNYPNGHYSRTITWSHEGFNEPDWEVVPDRYGGVWKKGRRFMKI